MKKNLSLVLALTLIMALMSVVGVSAAETVQLHLPQKLLYGTVPLHHHLQEVPVHRPTLI